MSEMNKSLLDTDIFSEILKRIDRNVVKKAIIYHNYTNELKILVIT